MREINTTQPAQQPAQPAESVEVSFRPAPSREARQYHLKDGILARKEGDRLLWELPLAEVESGDFANVTARGQRSNWLRLKAGEVTRSLEISASAAGWRDQEDVQAYLTLTRAVASGLAAAQPGFTLAFGAPGGVRTAIFAVGILSVAVGLVLLTIALLSGMSVERMLASGSIMGLMMLFGLVLIKVYWPWARPNTVPASALATILAVWARARP